ncbi:hypothetical protein JOF56_004821 [Kibdelosporangium banguiense]|uniref:Uncharacterized protein n=1 Tax=Kibdelosporangium banguiense TaxID=1365924 RepID=A0ABS4TJ37_9PSEU|nr:hypothetical protein [Kibdelosporangium banguiense]
MRVATSSGATACQAASKSKPGVASEVSSASGTVPAGAGESMTTMCSSGAPEERTRSTYWASQTTTFARALPRTNRIPSGDSVL